METELIKRLEAATEGDRELDEQIAGALGYEVGTRQANSTMEIAWWWQGPHGREPLPRFTGSVDAALSLVPKNLRYGIQVALGYAFVGIKDGSILNPATKEWCGYAKTAALAICAAALRARASL